MEVTSLALGPLGVAESILVGVASLFRMAKGELGHPIRSVVRHAKKQKRL